MVVRPHFRRFILVFHVLVLVYVVPSLVLLIGNHVRPSGHYNQESTITDLSIIEDIPTISNDAKNAVLCPPNIYSATTRIGDNSTMEIVGPMGCTISFLPDPLASLTSNQQENAWIVSSGGSFHWGVSMNLMRLLFPKEIGIPYPTPLERKYNKWVNETQGSNGARFDVVELMIPREGTPKFRAWKHFKIKNYSCDEHADVLLRVTVLYSQWMTLSANRFGTLVKKCGNHRPAPDLVVDVWGKWYDNCSHALWKHCFDHHVNQSNWKRMYRHDAKKLLRIADPLNKRSLLFVERSDGVQKTDRNMRKKQFIGNGSTGTHLTLSSDKSIHYSYILGHQTSAFAIGDAMTFLHTILGKRRDTNVIIDRACYDISFMNDDCNPQNAVYRSWTGPYWHFCETEAVPCSRSSGRANVELSSNELTDTPHKTSPLLTRSITINGISKRARWALVILCLLVIAAFVYTEGNKVPTQSMPGIGTLRFIASLHIVAGHLQRFGRAYMTPVPFAEYGYTWVPWFMLLSAFISSWSAINKKPRRECQAWYAFFMLRIRGIYPLYVAGLVATVINSTRHILIKRYIIDLLLIQSWYPGWTERAIMPHTWFLSAIAPCWMLHGFLFRRIEKVSTKKILFFFALVSGLPIILFGVMKCWWCGHKTNHFNSTFDAIVIMMKFHPLCYLPIYACGICIAHLLYRWKELQIECATVHDESCKIEGHEIKPLSLSNVELSGDTQDQIKISIPRTNLHPIVNNSIHYGCSIGAIGVFMSFYLARINQFHGAKLAFRLGALLPWHAFLLVGVAVGSPRDPVRRVFEIQWLQIFGNVSYAQYVFQFTWFHKWCGRVNAGFWIFCVAASIIVHYLIDRPYRSKKWTQGGGGILLTSLLIFLMGHYAHINIGTDSRLSLWAADDVSAHRWINPSVAWANNSTLLVYARRVQVDTSAWSPGSIWSSAIGVGELEMDTDKKNGIRFNAVTPAMRIFEQDSSTVTSCHTDSMWIRGEEDPKYFIVNGSQYLTAVHHIQRNDSCVASPTLVELNEKWSHYRRPILIQTPEDDVTSSKNWMHMKNYLFMTNLTTSTVVRVDPLDGKIKVLSNNTKPTTWLKDMHGGSNFVETTSVIDGAIVWMAVIHTANTYKNYLVEFEYNEPYVSSITNLR